MRPVDPPPPDIARVKVPGIVLLVIDPLKETVGPPALIDHETPGTVPPTEVDPLSG